MRNPFTFEVEPFEAGNMGYEGESWEVASGGAAKPQGTKLDCKQIILSGFVRGEYNIRMWHYEQLIDLPLPAPVLVIRGHTDNSGKDKPNLGLSLSRAFEVLQWLRLKNGDKPIASTLMVEGLGKTQPMVPNTSPANQAKNRRVEILWCKVPPSAPQGPMAVVRRIVLGGRVA